MQGNIYLFLITAENDNLQPTVIALNRQAEKIWIRTLSISLSLPDTPAIFWDGNNLNLFWLSEQHLYTAQMDTSGDVVGPLRAISGGKIVDSYDVVLEKEGSLTVWYAGQRRDPGLYRLDGDLTGEAVLIDSEGVRPSLQYDESGTLYASWAHYPPGFEETAFFYAVYPDGIYEAGWETAVYRPTLSPTDILTGPWMGFDQAQAYLVWNISVRTGPEAGKVVTEYVHFPKERVTAVIGPKTVAVPSIPDLDYTYEPEEGIAAGLRVFPFTGQYPRTLKVADVALNGAAYPAQELVLAFEAQVQHEFRKIRGQVATLFLQDGEPTGYQLLSYTADSSVDPAIFSDDAGQLYLTWLERSDAGGFQVYFASTAPDIKRALARATWGDMTLITRETVFGLLSGAVLSPIVVLLWMIAPELRRRAVRLSRGWGVDHAVLRGSTARTASGGS